MPTVAKPEAVPIMSSSFWLNRPVSRTAAYTKDKTFIHKIGARSIGETAGTIVGAGSAIWLIYDLFNNWGDGGVFKRIALACTTVGGGVLTWLAKPIKDLLEVDLISSALLSVFNRLTSLGKSEEFKDRFTKKFRDDEKAKFEEIFRKLSKERRAIVSKFIDGRYVDLFTEILDLNVRAVFGDGIVVKKLERMNSHDERVKALKRYAERNQQAVQKTLLELFKVEKETNVVQLGEAAKEVNNIVEPLGVELEFVVKEDIQSQVDSIITLGLETNNLLDVINFLSRGMLMFRISPSCKFASNQTTYRPYVEVLPVVLLKFLDSVRTKMESKGCKQFIQHILDEGTLPSNDPEVNKGLEILDKHLVPSLIESFQETSKMTDVSKSLLEAIGLGDAASNFSIAEIGYVEIKNDEKPKLQKIKQSLKALLGSSYALKKSAYQVFSNN